MRESAAYDVVVVGGGNAGYSAAHAAAEADAKVLLLEKAPAEWAGGNSRFIAGFLFSYDSADDLRAIADFTSEDDRSVISPYPNDLFRKDMMAASSGRSDPRLVDLLVEQSRDAITWLAKNQGWDTHYTKFGPKGWTFDMAGTMTRTAVMQLGFWIPITIVFGTLLGVVLFGRGKKA